MLEGHLDLLVLAVLADGAKHGYAVIETLRARSDEAFDLPEGTVYPVLHRLERSGHLRSDWSVAQGRRRRTYHLTDKGHKAFGEQRSQWVDFRSAVETVLGGAPWPATP